MDTWTASCCDGFQLKKCKLLINFEIDVSKQHSSQRDITVTTHIKASFLIKQDTKINFKSNFYSKHDWLEPVIRLLCYGRTPWSCGLIEKLKNKERSMQRRTKHAEKRTTRDKN